MPTAPTTTTTTTAARRPIELARYSISGHDRVLIGHRVDGIARISDAPAGGRGRTYLVDDDLQTVSEVNALIADYLTSARERDAIPMTVAILD